MIHFFVESDCLPLKGELVYRPNEYSFDFKVESESELARRAGSKGTISIVVGTLQLEVGIETGTVLFLWGLHEHSVRWRRDRLPSISSEKSCVKVRFEQEPTVGVSQGLAEVGEWNTTYDVQSGWICVSGEERDSAQRYVEFAEGTIVGLIDEKLVSVWLHPVR